MDQRALRRTACGFALMLGLILISNAAGTALQSDPFEPNDGLDNATRVELPFEQTGLLISSDDRDVFAFELTERSIVAIDIDAEAVGSSLDSVLALLNDAGEEVAFNDDSDGLDSAIRQPLDPGRYFAVVQGFFGSTGPYDIRIATQEPEPGEPNDTLAEATPVELPFEADDLRITSGDRDVFAFELRERAFVLIDVDARILASPLDSTIRLLDADGAEIVANDDADGLDPGLGRRLDPGRYFVVVEGFDSSSSGPYRLRLRTDEPTTCQERTILDQEREVWDLGTLEPGQRRTVVLQGPTDADFDLLILDVLSEQPMVTAIWRRAFGLTSDALISFVVDGERARPFLAAVSSFRNGGDYSLCLFDEPS